MNLRSSTTPRFDGSAIATVSCRPSRLSGSTVCFDASSAGISLSSFVSISNLARSTAGIRNCRASMRTTSVSLTNPILTTSTPMSVPGFCCCSCNTAASFSRVSSPSRTSSSPRRIVGCAATGRAGAAMECEESRRLFEECQPPGRRFACGSSSCTGRGLPENVTSGERRAAVEGPMPRT